jgi:hypothetical protein
MQFLLHVSIFTQKTSSTQLYEGILAKETLQEIMVADQTSLSGKK